MKGDARKGKRQMKEWTRTNAGREIREIEEFENSELEDEEKQRNKSLVKETERRK